MSTFISIPKKRINFNFVEPRTGEEILKEMSENQKRYGHNKDEYKIVEETEEEKLVKAKDEKVIKNIKENNKEIIKTRDYKEAKVIDNFNTETEKSLENFAVKKDGCYEIHSRMPNKILVKQLLSIVSSVEEKKKIVNEESNLLLDEARKNKSFVEIMLNGKNYKVKFIGESR